MLIKIRIVFQLLRRLEYAEAYETTGRSSGNLRLGRSPMVHRMLALPGARHSLVVVGMVAAAPALRPRSQKCGLHDPKGPAIPHSFKGVLSHVGNL